MNEDREDLILKAIDELKKDMKEGFEKIEKRITPLETFKTQYETIRTALIALILVGAAAMAFLWNYTNYTNYRQPAQAVQVK